METRRGQESSAATKSSCRHLKVIRRTVKLVVRNGLSGRIREKLLGEEAAVLCVLWLLKVSL